MPVSRPWPVRVKQWVALGLVALLLIVLRLLWEFLTPLALALLLAYILTPVVNFVQRRTGWPRLAAVALVYLILIFLLVLAPLTVTPLIVDQVGGIAGNFSQIEENLIERVNSLEPVRVGTLVFDPGALIDPLVDQLQQFLLGLLPVSVDLFFGVATGFLASVLWLIFILVISFHLVRDAHRIQSYVLELAPPSYTEDVYMLVQRINAVWNSFLRGQLILSATVGTAVTIALFILGVPNALLLGLLAGLLEMVPTIGPFLSALPAVLIAYFSGSSNWEISNTLFALLVIATYTLIQQIENNYLVPRIIGGSVNLHPVVVLIGTIVGASQAGILGIFLAAPALASIRVVAGYAYRKLLQPSGRIWAEEPDGNGPEDEEIPLMEIAPPPIQEY